MLNKFILFFSSLFFLSSCLNFGGGLEFSYNLPSVGEGSLPSNSEYFYIDLDTKKYKSSGELVPYYEISTTTEYGDAEERDSLSNCEIYYDSANADENERTASEEPLLCILDLLEYDLKVKDTHITYNFPEGMCEYIEVSLPWHFNAEILPGPIVYEDEREKNPPSPSDCKTNDEVECEKETFLCDRNRIVVGNVVKYKSQLEKGEKGKDYCISSEDKTEEDLCPTSGSFKNKGDQSVRCCNRGKKLDDTEWQPDIRCFGGPALVAEMEGHERSRFGSNLTMTSPEGGLKGYIKLPGFISDGELDLANDKSGYTSVGSSVINYFEDLDRSADKLRDLSRNSLPDFLQKSAYYGARPKLFFEFSCLDSGGEILHKILMMIRDWNTYEEFREFYDDGGNDSADPNVEGFEGDDCKYEDLGTLKEEFEECNDVLDLDDIGNCKRYAWCKYFNQRSRIDQEKKVYPRITYPSGTLETNSSSNE